MSNHFYDEYGKTRHRYLKSINEAIKKPSAQKFLMEFRDKLEALPVKKIALNNFDGDKNRVCAIGLFLNESLFRKLEGCEEYLSYASYIISTKLNIDIAIVLEILYYNNNGSYRQESDGDRWTRMRNWVEGKIYKGVLSND